MSVKILVVDDEPDLELLLRQKFRKQIREKEFEFVFAHDGEEALLKLAESPELDMVLTDINMPRMDGLTLLLKIKESAITVKSVIVSAYGDLGNIRTAMNRGAFDFLTKPIDFTDLEITIAKTREQIQMIKQAAHEHNQLQSLRQELNIASNIQKSILPSTFPPFPGRTEFDIYARMEPAKEVGGDFYDFFMISPDRIGFVVGDVSGKGVPAAIFMAVCRTLLRATAVTQKTNAEETMECVNRILCEEDTTSMFVTMLYGILDLRTGEVNYCMGGHEVPVIIRADGRLEVDSPPRNLVLAAEPDLPFRGRKIILHPGDAFVIYSDGVTEAESATGEFFQRERLLQGLDRCSSMTCDNIVKGVVHDVNQFAVGAEQSDDITCLAIRYLSAM